MPDEFVAYSLAHHPAPNRHRVSLGALFYGLFAAPIFWAGDLMIDFALVGHGCYPGDLPLGRPTAGFGWIWPVLLACHLITFAVVLSGIAVSYRNWRVTGPPQGHHHHLIDRGEGRTRYLGIVGMGFGVMFLLIVAAETIALGFVPLCSY